MDEEAGEMLKYVKREPNVQEDLNIVAVKKVL